MLELCVATFLVDFAPTGGFQQSDYFVTRHGRIIHTSTHAEHTSKSALQEAGIALFAAMLIADLSFIHAWFFKSRISLVCSIAVPAIQLSQRASEASYKRHHVESPQLARL